LVDRFVKEEHERNPTVTRVDKNHKKLWEGKKLKVQGANSVVK